MKYLKLYEEIANPSPKKEFTEDELKYYQKLWDFLHEKYRYNKFFLTMWNQANKRKYLTKKQWLELEYLLKNGRSRYEAGILPSNY